MIVINFHSSNYMY